MDSPKALTECLTTLNRSCIVLYVSILLVAGFDSTRKPKKSVENAHDLSVIAATKPLNLSRLAKMKRHTVS
jgi:hypothetical protein